jgi:hypothetical protein
MVIIWILRVSRGDPDIPVIVALFVAKSDTLSDG